MLPLLWGPAVEGVSIGVGWHLLGSPLCQSTWVNLERAVDTLAARKEGGRLDHNSVLQLLSLLGT